MLGFPLPYPNELLYSTVARAGIHEGETSPKQLLDLVFNNRQVIATVDLPSHIKDIASQYPESLHLFAEKLIKEHTLWPIYAPFLPGKRCKAIEQWMKAESYGAPHLATGVAASRIKHKLTMYLCPKCMQEQQSEFGESYWDRRWHIPLVKTCEKHGALYKTNIRLNGEHRHSFIGISEAEFSRQLDIEQSDEKLSRLAIQLLKLDNQKSPSYWQWTQFYRQIAMQYGFKRGNCIDHEKIQSEYISHWDCSWLNQENLLWEESDTSWIKSIFRKHRKVFSFAEHITVVDAISFGQLSVTDAIKNALQLPVTEPVKKVLINSSSKKQTQDQYLWEEVVKRIGAKKARQQQPALYTRLYRYNKAWLIAINNKNRRKFTAVNKRINWKKRDKKAAKKLLKLLDSIEDNLHQPRLSKTYLIHQLTESASVEKNLDKLPRCRTILAMYSESVSDYQIRRLTAIIINNHKNHKNHQVLKRWSLLREAGLSDERITKEANIFLKGILLQ